MLIKAITHWRKKIITHLKIHGLLDALKDEEQEVPKEVLKAEESLKGDKEVL